MNETKNKKQENEYIRGRNCCGFTGVADSSSLADNKKYECMSVCRWFPLIPVVLAILAITAGYVLTPSTIRIIWLGISIIIMGFGLFALVMMRTMTRESGKISCC